MRLLISSLIALCVTAWAAPVVQGTSFELPLVRDLSRASSHGPPSHDLTLWVDKKNLKFKVRKNEEQGEHGVVYKVVAGKYKGGYAKALISEQEIQATAAVGALWLKGSDHHNDKWIIVKPSPGKRFNQTSAYAHVRHNPQQCWELLEHAIDVATNTILHTYRNTHWLHQHPTLSNVLFNDQASRAYLIDWGCASKPPHVHIPDVRAHGAYTMSQSGHSLCGARPATAHPPVMHAPTYHCPAPAHGAVALQPWH
ncbi:uncharacterized protein B0H18DRAFT_955970 [Fomitopsis serialis]|uniref:uncharacterized protein n=1 Tax=Fomitopsis serialis TaxID=139415 RepID=UPI002007A1B6|nr:uncharacterized protein B0H18DRAFT_955970 [Neoantrodia serialis]KAH9923289.1 hypothetical protein B0H18DRAFT_955970 [Neoantrodia serialis]